MIAGLVSTVIPVYNRPARLVDAVESVIAQTYRPIEVIVVDDGSTDDTWVRAQELSARYAGEVRAIRQENAGVGMAREAGRQLIRGEFVQYLDSDDVLLPTKFALQVAGLRAHPDCGVSYGMTRLRRSDGTLHAGAWKGSGIPVETMFPSFLTSRWWDTPTPLYRRAVCDAAGPWMALRGEEDWERDCRIAALGVRLQFVPEFVAEVRDHSEGRLSGNKGLDAGRLRDRARAHEAVLSHALRAGVAVGSDEMRHFARALFLLARQCGAARLPNESRMLLKLAGSVSERQTDLRIYQGIASVVGLTALGRLSCYADKLRR